MRTLRLSDLPFPCLWAPGNVTRLKNDDDEEEDGYESGSSDGDTETRDERMENMEILLYLIQMGDTGEALKYSARMPRHLQPSAPSVIEHKKPRRKRRLRSVGFTTLQRRESAKAIFRQSCIHDQVTYNKLCPRCVYPATVMGPR